MRTGCIWLLSPPSQSDLIFLKNTAKDQEVEAIAIL
jgi:hypothetical protein